MSLKHLNKNEARKLLIKMMANDCKILFTDHAIKELKNDDLDRVDAINILSSSASKIVDEPEQKNGNWRYRVITEKICVVIEFKSVNGILVITVFRMKRSK